MNDIKHKIFFTKAQALGNDFIIAENLSAYPKEVLCRLANRRLGIGCDQLISFENYSHKDTDFTIRFYNSDGSWAGACGNGSRAVAGYYAKKSYKDSFSFAIEQPSGGYAVLSAKIMQEHCALKMEKPRFSAKNIPLSNLELDAQYIPLNSLVENVSVDMTGFCVNVGNPHIVFTTDSPEIIPLEIWGSIIETHPLFPERTNVEFISILDRRNIRMRVWERGAGITQACGTGACASAICAIKKDLCDETVNIHCDGGVMQVYYDKNTQTLMLSGAYDIVFSGEIELT